MKERTAPVRAGSEGVSIKGVVYSTLLTGLFSLYLLRGLGLPPTAVLGAAVPVFLVFTGMCHLWGRDEKSKRAVSLIILTGVLSLILAYYSVAFAINTFLIFTVGILTLTYREEFLPFMPAFMYCWIGAVVGFIVSLLVLPRVTLGDAEKATALVTTIILFAWLFLLIGRKVQYRPFNRYPIR
ncbi:hypothetical protein [Thermococcus sp.]